MKKWLLLVAIPLLGIGMVMAFFMFILFGDNNFEEDSRGGGMTGCSIDGLNHQKWNTTFKKAGVLKEKGDKIIEVAEKQGVDPVLFAAITFSETGWGTSNAVVNYHNPGGIMDTATGMATVKHFKSLDDGLEAMGVTLHNRIVVDKLDTVEKLGNVYAPIGVSNDPTNLNANWIPTVKGMITQLGGLTKNCSNEGSGGTGKYIIPVDNPSVSSGFVNRINPVTGVAEHHKGLDFANPIGSPIKAADDGKVVVAKHNAPSGSGYGGYGNVTVIEHSKNKEWTLYAHQSEIDVKEGQQVKQGDVIGKIGSTGQSTGPHLHFEIRKQLMGGQIDPSPVLGIIPKN